MLELKTQEVLPTRQFALKTNARPERLMLRQRAALLPDTRVHPLTFVIPFASTAAFLLACWVAFGAGAYMELGMVTLITVMFAGLMAAGGAFSRDMTPERRRDRTFRQFLNGTVDTYTGLISGREALMQIATMPVVLAVGGIVFVAIAILR